LHHVLTWGRYRAGTVVELGAVLFPKLEMASVALR